MKTNKYLSKIASFDGAIKSVIGYGDRLIGHTAGEYRALHKNLARAHDMGVSGVSQSTIDSAKKLADNHSSASKMTRIKTGLTVGGLGLGGYALARNHQKRKDRALLDSILAEQQNLT